MELDEGSGEIAIYGLHNPNDTNLYSKTIRNHNDIVDLTTERGINFIFVQYALRKTGVLRNVIERDLFYIDNYEIFMNLLKRFKYDDLFTDNFATDFGHATPLGNRVIADNVAKKLLKLLEP